MQIKMKPAMMRLLAGCLLSGAVAIAAHAAPTLDAGDAVIPRPSQASAGRGAFVLTAATPVLGNGAAAATARQLAGALHLPLGAGNGPAIVLEMVPAAGARPESYTLSLKPEGIRIQASDSAGLFYGAQSLRQLVVPRTARRCPRWRSPTPRALPGAACWSTWPTISSQSRR